MKTGELVACQHEFVFLRQERKNVGADRNPIWLVEDLHYCRKCLEYRRVVVEKRIQRPHEIGEYVEKFVVLFLYVWTALAFFGLSFYSIWLTLGD